MRIALQTWGSDGDIRPFIALGAGLVSRGHQVRLAIGSVDDKDYTAMCSAVGVESVRAPLRSGLQLATWMGKMGRTRNPYKMVRILHEFALFPAFPEMTVAAEALGEWAELAVGHFLAVPLRLAAEKRGLGYASFVFWPGLVPDDARPPDGLPALGRTFNRWLWRLGFWLLDRTVGEGYRALYRAAGRQPPGRFEELCYSARLNLIACSPALWPGSGPTGQHRFCGYLHTPGESEPEPLPAHVEEFLAAGEPPLFLTLGSSAQVDPDRCEALLVEAAERTGRRAIIQLGPGRVAPKAGAKLCFIGKTSHSALLPRCSAVVHHGGAGTTHTALAAGCPAVVVGFMDEQLSWGRCLGRFGVGHGVYRYPFVRPAQVARSLARIAADDAMHSRAKALGATLRLEDGVGEAVRQIEALVR